MLLCPYFLLMSRRSILLRILFKRYFFFTSKFYFIFLLVDFVKLFASSPIASIFIIKSRVKIDYFL
jgi:hypothetical protein